MRVGNGLQTCGSNKAPRLGVEFDGLSRARRGKLPNRHDDDDALAACKGILVGVMLGVLCWVLPIAFLWLLLAR